VAVTARIGSGLATGALRLGVGRPFAKGGGLPLAGAEGFFQAPGQLGDLSSEFSELLLQGPATGAVGFVHPAVVGTGGAFSCACLDSWKHGQARTR
jgi:hypothetical protein